MTKNTKQNLLCNIGDIVEFLLGMQGDISFSPGTKAEVVGIGREGIYYVRLLNSSTLLEINSRNDYQTIKKVQGSKVYK